MPYKDKKTALANSRKSYKKQMQSLEWKEARRVKSAAYMKEYYKRSAKHREKNRIRSKRWKIDNKEYNNFTITLNRYGITLDQCHAKAESQDFLCAICQDMEIQVVDHNHTTNKVRGLLCWSCNTGIGGLKEDLNLFDRAKNYLIRWI